MLYREATESDWRHRIEESRASYDTYFREVAHGRYPEFYERAVERATHMFERTAGLRVAAAIATVINEDPQLLQAMRHACAPTLAPDRLENLAGVSGSFCDCEKTGRLQQRDGQVARVAEVIAAFANPEIQQVYDEEGAEAAARMIASVLANSTFASWFRNSLESEQRSKLAEYLKQFGYTDASEKHHGIWTVASIPLAAGEYCFGRAVKYNKSGSMDGVLPIDCIVMPADGSPVVLLELKSAGDETNTNKRANEENQKAVKLAETYPDTPYEYAVVLWGYFGTRYCSSVKSRLHFVWDDDLSHLADLGV